MHLVPVSVLRYFPRINSFNPHHLRGRCCYNAHFAQKKERNIMRLNSLTPAVTSVINSRARFWSLVVATRVGAEMKPFTPRYMRTCSRADVRFLTLICIFYFFGYCFSSSQGPTLICLFPKHPSSYPTGLALHCSLILKRHVFLPAGNTPGAGTPRGLFSFIFFDSRLKFTTSRYTMTTKQNAHKKCHK